MPVNKLQVNYSIDIDHRTKDTYVKCVERLYTQGKYPYLKYILDFVLCTELSG